MHERTNAETVDRARRLHDRAIVMDTHCDTTLRLAEPGFDIAERHHDGHVDLPRLREGGVSALILAVWARGPLASGEGVAAARQQFAHVREMLDAHSDAMTAARTAGDIRAAKEAGKVAVLVAIEGGYLIEDSLDVLREYHDKGAVYLTLTHAFHTSWADSSGVHEPLAPHHGGLTAFGRAVIRELNRLGMMVDVSHSSDDTFWHVLEETTAPVIATHSSCRAVSPHRRNLSDEMIKAIAENGGIVQINFASAFIDPNYPPVSKTTVCGQTADGGSPVPPPRPDYVTPLSVLVDHFDHALQLVGPRHVGIGSDYDGVPAVPQGVEDCSKLPNLTAELLARGYSEDDLALVLGENVLRVMEQCAAVARSNG